MKHIPSLALLLSLVALLVSGTVDPTTPPAADAPGVASVLEGGDVVAARPVTLKAGADAAAFEAYVAEVYTPAFDHHVPGVKAFVMKGERGKNKGAYVLVYVFDSAATRDFYYPTEGQGVSEAGGALWNQLPEFSMSDYLAPADTTTVNYTDYLVID